MGIVYGIEYESEIIYIGKTKCALEFKWGQHVEESRRILENLGVQNPLKINAFLTPEIIDQCTIIILEETADPDLLNEAKFNFISKYASPSLLNVRGNPFANSRPPKKQRVDSPYKGMTIGEINKATSAARNYNRGLAVSQAKVDALIGDEWSNKELAEQDFHSNHITRAVKYGTIVRTKRAHYRRGTPDEAKRKEYL